MLDQAYLENLASDHSLESMSSSLPCDCICRMSLISFRRILYLSDVVRFIIG